MPQDDKEAVNWYRKAAEQGNAYGQNKLAIMYRNAKGVSQDDKEAVKWYRKAAEQGLAVAHNNLAFICTKRDWASHKITKRQSIGHAKRLIRETPVPRTVWAFCTRMVTVSPRTSPRP